MATAKNKTFLMPGVFGKLNGRYNSHSMAQSKKNSLQKWIKMASPNPLGTIKNGKSRISKTGRN